MPQEKERQRKKSDPSKPEEESQLEDQKSLDDILDKSKEIIRKNQENAKKHEQKKQ